MWSRPRPGSRAVVATVSEPRESALIGMHGSLTSADQLVPLLAWPPDVEAMAAGYRPAG